MHSRRFTLIFSTIFLILVYVINASVGQMMGNLALVFPFDIMPPGITFGVARGLIYLSLAVMLVYLWIGDYAWTQAQFRFHQLFWMTCLLNVTWIIVTSVERYAVSVAVIVLLAFALWRLLGHILDHQLEWPGFSYLVSAPIGLYLGWVMTASSVVGSSQAVYLFETHYALSFAWQFFALILGLGVGLYAWYRFRYDMVLVLLIWALAGIASKNLSMEPSYSVLSVFGVILFASLIANDYRKKTRSS